ncbi:MAG: DNA polymerase III subunit alpha [Gammaproteobacteria bacterium]
MGSGFVHLRVHTEFSLLDSVVRIKPLMKAVADGGMAAVAVTDDTNLFAMVKAYRQALNTGVKPIIGADLWVVDGTDDPPSLLTLLCQHHAGFLNLSALITRAYLEGQQRGRAYVHADWLDDGATDGLIALSGGHVGDVGRALLGPHPERASDIAARHVARFGDRYYLEVSRTGRADEDRHLHAAVALASEQQIPLVATNDVRFLDSDDFVAHEARVCIHEGFTLSDPRRPKIYTDQQSLRSAAQMRELFADLPEALDNTVHVAQRCSLDLNLGDSVLPEFPIPDGRSAAQALTDDARAGLVERLAQAGIARSADYDERLAIELGVIESMGFPGYFLIVADFIRWARENDVPVGPGRGSGAGSLVAYCLGITDLDPLEYDLLFERFLNPERVSMPDFDVDFCMEGRDRVIEYVAERYGRERVSQIITYGTMAAKAVVRDVGRVLGHPYGFVDRIAKLIPFEVGMTLDQAMSQEAELKQLYQDDGEVRALLDLALRLEGISRNAGKHAGGVVIAPSRLTDFTPLYCEEGSDSTVTQLDKDDVEAAGLVKFDFLGLRTLTIIDWSVKTINRARADSGEGPLELSKLAMTDAGAFDLLKRCATTAVFQLESRGMKDLIKRLRPDSFDDIVALVALFRPGPLQSGMVDDFIKRKHGEEVVEYPHPALKTILEPTYGVILYQEQVMQIAQELAGYTLGGADLLRRAMGKKKASEMAKQRSVFVDGCVANDVDKDRAMYIFDLMEKFAGYGFNKSHSAAYAVLSYQTAWLKAHYPAAFMAAVMSADMDNTDKVDLLIRDCVEQNLRVQIPDINASSYEFTVAGERDILYGLGALKGVGRGAVMSIIEAREADGPYQDIDDLCARVDLQKLNRRAFEALIKAGALDALGEHRGSLLEDLPDALRAAEQSAKDAAAGQSDLFGGGSTTVTAPPRRRQSVAPLHSQDRLAMEKQALGLWLTGHPVDAVRRELADLTGGNIQKSLEVLGPPPTDGPRRRGPPIIVGGLIDMIQRRGGRLNLVLDDCSARVEVTMSEETAEQYRSVIGKERIVLVEGTVRFDDFLNDWRITARHIEPLDQARERRATHVLLNLIDGIDGPEFVQQLRQILGPYRPGRCAVHVHYRGDVAAARLTLGQDWAVTPNGELLRELAGLVGEDGVRLVYPADASHVAPAEHGMASGM